MSLEIFCSKRVTSARPEEPAVAVAQRMRDEHVGCVAIVDATERLIGVVTDRDLVIRLLAEQASANDAIERFMTRDPTTVRRDAQPHEVVIAMRSAGVRRLPIVDDSARVVGFVSLDDVSVMLAGEMRMYAEAIEFNRGP